MSSAVQQMMAWRDQFRQMKNGLGIDAFGKAWQQEAVKRCPVGTHYHFDGSSFTGGQLKASIRWIQDSANSGHLEMLGYGAVVVEGAPSYSIVLPKGGKRMAFYWARKGFSMRARHVTLPERPPRPFVWEAFDAALDQWWKSLGGTP